MPSVRGRAGPKPPFKTHIVSARGLHRPEAVRSRGRQGDMRVIHRRIIMSPPSLLPSSKQRDSCSQMPLCLEQACAWSPGCRHRQGEESLVDLLQAADPDRGRRRTRGQAVHGLWGCGRIPRRSLVRFVPARALPRRPPSVLSDTACQARVGSARGRAFTTRAVLDYEWTASRSGQPIAGV